MSSDCLLSMISEGISVCFIPIRKKGDCVSLFFFLLCPVIPRLSLRQHQSTTRFVCRISVSSVPGFYSGLACKSVGNLAFWILLLFGHLIAHPWIIRSLIIIALRPLIDSLPTFIVLPVPHPFDHGATPLIPPWWLI